MARGPRATAAKKAAPGGVPPPAGFSGFAPDAFAFFANLARHNKRAWFVARKAQFERDCQAPLKALTAALDPPLGADRLSRIYRDVRFSKDKSPYHTHISARVKGVFLMLSAEGLYVGTGLYMPEAPTLRRLRDAIGRDASGQPFAELVTALRKKGYTVASHESVASAPRGFSRDHPRIELLRMKDIHAGKMLKPAKLRSVAAVSKVQRVCDDVEPFRQWLRRHVGPASCA